jgi:phage antirepressor YoqD-like protein
LATRLKEAQSKAAVLEARVRESEPKVLFADAVSVSKSEILIGDLAKILKQNGIDIGEKRLFERLRNEGFLMKTGMSWNLPTQRAMNLGLFRVQEISISKPDGTTLLSRTTRVTGKGQVYLVNYFLKKALCVAF